MIRLTNKRFVFKLSLNGATDKQLFEVFLRAGSGCNHCKISTLSVNPFMFFVHRNHIFDENI